jgi:GTP-sensing pleiotropic transcriptional regulator CodY
MPIEQCRWNQANIDTLFYAGNQSYINRNFSFSPGITSQQYYFNLVQQPINMVTGYQRQHRKSIVYQAADGADPQTTDQYTRLIKNVIQKEGINEQYSKSCELAAVAGMNLLQPYLDFTGDDPAQGQMKLKIWEYNSFLVDPYFRNPDMSDAQFVWCQEYISKQEAEVRFPDKAKTISPMAGTPQRYGNFYFLPENYNMARNDLMVLSYVWYKWKKRKKKLYSRKLNQFFDFAGGDGNLEQILYHIDDMEEVTVEAPCWKLAVILNDQLMFQGENPLWDGPECPFIPNYWNYDPHINQYDLRSRSLIFPMRSSQFLFNYKVIMNNDIQAATINSGYKRKVGAVANEDNLKKAQPGFDIIINEDYQMTDVEKIVPTAIPESDLALAQQMSDLIFSTSGINLENWSGQDDKQSSSLTLLIKQAANLMVFQKYFDQWDHCLKLVGERMLQMALQNWSAEKIGMMLGEEPSPHFYSKVFAKYKTLVEEADNTPTQQNLQAQHMLEINERFGREVFPPSMIVPKLNISGKGEIIPFLQQQEEQAQHQQQEAQNVAHMFEEAKLKELYSKAVSNIARAREDHSRSESNLGLFEERISMIQRNQAMTLTEKQKALTSLLENIQRFGEIETSYAENKLKVDTFNVQNTEELEKQDVERRTEANKFLEQIIGAGANMDSQQQNPMQNQEAM